MGTAFNTLLVNSPAGENPVATLLVDEGEVCTLVNLDPSVSIQLGDNNSIQPTDAQGISVLGPLNAIPFDGTLPVYGVASAGTKALVAKYGSAVDWQVSPVQSAAQLALSGFPVLANPTLLDSFASLLIPGGGSNRPHYAINQPSYEGTLSVITSLAASLDLVQVNLQWDINGVTVDNDLFTIAAPISPGTAQAISFRGPTKGNGLTVQFLGGGSGDVTVSAFQFFQSSRLFDHDDWHSSNTPSNFFGPVSFPTGAAPRMRLLATLPGVSIPGSTSQNFILPFWTGKFNIKANTGSNTNDLQITMTGVLSTALLFNLKSDATGSILVTDLFMSREQYLMTVRNANVAAETINLYITADEY